MKRNWFLIFSLAWLLVLSFLASCVSFEDKPSKKYTLYLNDSPVSSDSVYLVVGANITAKVLDASSNPVSATFDFGNGNKLSGNTATNKYQTVGKYKLTATTADGVITTANIVITKALKFTLKINNNVITDGATFKTVAKTPLTFKVVDADGKALTTGFDFGNGSKITADSATISYAAGSYNLKAVTGKNTIIAKIEVAKASSESIILLSSTVSGGTINAVFGLKCSLISGVSFTKDTYVSGEIPGQYWKDYKVVPTDTVKIDDVPYFKWNVSAPAGKFRFSWIQLKDSETQFSYDHCNWANDLGSKYWSTTEGLFVMYTKIVNGQATISSTN